MSEPISTITNVAYLIVALLVWHWLITPILIGLWITSTGYHWTKHREWQRWDMRFVYATMLAIGGSLVLSGEFLLLFTVLAMALVWENKSDMSSSYWVPAIFGVLAVIALVQGVHWLFLPVFAVAGLCNIPFLYLHWNKRLTDALHGMWHILTAIGLYLII